MLENTGELIIQSANIIWGTPLLVLLLGGGLFFLIYSRLAPLRYIGHALSILTGKYDNPNEPGQLKHYEALSTALAGTIGMGNISGVAVAIATGGPGAMFWMWISALLGVSTKFFECTLAVMFRGKDSNGEIQGGPMYFITEGLGKKWKPVAIFLCCGRNDWRFTYVSGQPVNPNFERCNFHSQHGSCSQRTSACILELL
jgi:alanine or glycine:cation symporter, AGCS family